MKKSLSFLIISIVLSTLFFGSCASYKKVTYFHNADSLQYKAMQYDAKIMPNDELTITVLTSNPAAAVPFNLSVSNTVGSSGQLTTGSGTLQTYLVNNEGIIDFPVIGKLHVEGLTKNQCEDLIREKVKPYLSETENPIVTVKMSSSHVTIIGETGSTGTVPITNGKLNIIEALAQKGDLGIYGKRDNILLVREDANGQRHAHRLNINKADIFNSPYYYLQQNDIIYVEPNKIKAYNSSIGSSTSILISIVGILTSLASLVVNILR